MTEIDIETAFDMIQMGSADKYAGWDEIVLEQFVQEKLDASDFYHADDCEITASDIVKYIHDQREE